MKVYLKILILSAAIIAQLAFAGDKEIYVKFFEDFQKGAYASALDSLKTLSKKEKSSSTAQYWTGQTQSKLQKFDLAEGPLQRAAALDRGKTFSDVYFLLGQSLYATKKTKPALSAFENSLKINYKPHACLYYMGTLEGTLGNDKKAVKTFNKILETKSPEEEDFKQSALFQIAETNFKLAQRLPLKTKEQKIAKKDAFFNVVIKSYDEVIKYKKDAPLAGQATARLAMINKMYGIHPKAEEISDEPRRPAQAWVIRLSQDFKYDSNLTNQASGKLERVSYTDAVLGKTTVFSKYEFILSRSTALTPEVSWDYSKHLSSDPVVFTNDTMTITPALRTRIDHKVKKKDAAVLLEYEYNNTRQDYLKQHEMTYKSSYHNFIAGERFEVLPWGSTTLKFLYKNSNNKSETSDYYAPKFSLGQNIGVGGGRILNSTLSWENQYSRDPYNDQRTYGWNNSLGLTKLFWNTTVDLSLNFTFTDTLMQRDARGIEKTINPGFTFTKEISKLLSGKFDYSFTRNISHDKQSYDYVKHAVTLGVTATF